MLSSRMMSAPASAASDASATVWASTSTGRPGEAARAFATACAIPPARRMWLSLIRIRSNNPKRWLLPPPTRTAYFSRSRRLGVVLRVSSTVMRPAAAST